MKLNEFNLNSRLLELLSSSPTLGDTDDTIVADPNAPKVSPQAQLAQHQKEVTAKKKQIQDQITLLNKQIMDLKKQLTLIK